MSVFDPLSELNTERRPRVLVFGTAVSRVAGQVIAGFCEAGCTVAALLPEHYSLEKNRKPVARFDFSGLETLNSMRDAITSFAPDVVTPTCRRSATLLRRLHYVARREGMPHIAECIERSLGHASSFAVVEHRYAVLAIARQEGVLVPEMMPMLDECDMGAWKGGFPCAIKADGGIECQESRMAANAQEACEAWGEMRRKSKRELLERLALERGRRQAWAAWHDPRPAVMAQAWIKGKPASCAISCWQGEVLGCVSVEVVARQWECGPATMVDVVEGRAMEDAARRVVARLGLSGLYAFEFVMEQPGGRLYLVGVKDHATEITPLALGQGRNPIAALAARLAGEDEPMTTTASRKTRIALPQTQRPAEAVQARGVLGVLLDRLKPRPAEIRPAWVYTEPAKPKRGASGSKVA